MWYGKHLTSENLFKGENPPANPGNFQELTEEEYNEAVRLYKENQKKAVK